MEDDAEIAAMAGPDISQDVAEQQELIKNLKAQRASDMSTGDDNANSKRTREEEDSLVIRLPRHLVPILLRWHILWMRNSPASYPDRKSVV